VLSDSQAQSEWRLNEIAMSESRLVYLNLGSNIEPEANLVKAIRLLKTYGEIQKVSSAWESRSLGAVGPNYLNACVAFISPFLMPLELKDRIIRPIEAQLGRKRSENKFDPRTIDIDIVLFDDKPYSDKFWKFGFVMVPLAELYPEYQNPLTKESILQTAARLRREVWMEARPDVLSQFRGNSNKVQI
jgi:2-amino-4-hydroxy-6-hydroxymethyldihydropteridine diphosphokinase